MQKSQKRTAPILLILAFILAIPTAHAQSPTIDCGTIDEQNNTLTIPVIVDLGTMEADQIRMEMAYTASALSNPTIALGADMNLEFGQQLVENTIYTLFSKEGDVLTGQIEYAIVTFDWTGDVYEITFNQGVIEGEKGSLAYKTGDLTAIAEGSCNVSAETLSPDTIETGNGNMNPILIGVIGILLGLGVAILLRRSRS